MSLREGQKPEACCHAGLLRAIPGTSIQPSHDRDAKQTMVKGKYRDLADLARISAEAEAVVLVVLNGNDGSGFSVHAESGINELLPSILRRIADEISNH